MAYPGYDGFARSMSRRQSIAYGATPLTYPHQAIYPETMMSHGITDVCIFPLTNLPR